MRIGLIGKFDKLHDEEYIARSFEMLGHDVVRIDSHQDPTLVHRKLLLTQVDLLIFNKYVLKPPVQEAIKRMNIKTVCWVFDLYFNYTREFRLKNDNYFKADYVFTTDGGNDNRFKELNINHKCVRQGIFKDECVLYPFKNIRHEIVFVGSDSPVYPERSKLVRELGARWFGKKDTNELRGTDLNELYSMTRIVIGNSFYSPHYWSNRIVETLGRGGFLIHQDVEGLKEEYPFLVTYERGNVADLKSKIEYYTEHEEERREIIKKNYEWVRDNYTMEKQCQKLLNLINQ